MEKMGYALPEDENTDDSDLFSLMELPKYSPSEEQKSQLRYLSSLLEWSCEKGIKVSLVWWYWLDSLLWILTRDHWDFDLLIPENNIEEFKKILISLWFNLFEETSFVVRFKNKDGLKIEFNNKWTLSKLGIKENDQIYFPEKPNGNLHWIEIYTPDLSWHKKLIQMQNKRAEEQHWSEYKYQDHQEKLIRFLEENF